LALDTGATTTLLNVGILAAVGYDPAQADTHVFVTTATAIQYVPKIRLIGIEALSLRRTQFPVLAGSLPPSAAVDGLPGLDFLQRKRLTLDFRKGRITLR